MTSLTNSLRKTVAIAAVMMAFSGLALADSLTGTVTNKTTGKPAAGDEVVLLKLAQGMQELTRTKTDAKGQFTLEVPDQEMHLVRVMHDKAAYFRPAPVGAESVEIDVYNAAAKVKGVSTEAHIMRVQTDESGKALKVVENFFVKNESSPAMTQFSDRPFEFYLPTGAVIEGSAALAPGGMPVQSQPVPLGDANHYAFAFPIRPGQTRFQISYRLPYSGSLTFAPKLANTVGTAVVMLPKSMTFEPDASADYQVVSDEQITAQTFVLRNVEPTQSAGFKVSGAGQLPRDNGVAQGGASDGTGNAAAGAGATGGGATSGATSDNRPGGGLGVPIDPEGANDPWAKYKWWIIGGLGLLLAAGAGVMLKGDGGPLVVSSAPIAGAPVASPTISQPGASSLLATLKDELFALETERLQGRLTEAEFAEQKAALEIVLKRALFRDGAKGTGEPV